MNESEKNVSMNSIAWKLSKHGVFSGPCFPVFGLNTEISVFSPNVGKYGPEKTPYLKDNHRVKYQFFIFNSWRENLIENLVFQVIN